MTSSIHSEFNWPFTMNAIFWTIYKILNNDVVVWKSKFNFIEAFNPLTCGTAAGCGNDDVGVSNQGEFISFVNFVTIVNLWTSFKNKIPSLNPNDLECFFIKLNQLFDNSNEIEMWYLFFVFICTFLYKTHHVPYIRSTIHGCSKWAKILS